MDDHCEWAWYFQDQSNIYFKVTNILNSKFVSLIVGTYGFVFVKFVGFYGYSFTMN